MYEMMVVKAALRRSGQGQVKGAGFSMEREEPVQCSSIT
jgi:hypothetical protein